MAQPDSHKENCHFNCSSHQFLNRDKLSASHPSARTDMGPPCFDWQVHEQFPRCQPHSIWPFHFKWKPLKSLPCSDICLFMSFPLCANTCYLLAKVPKLRNLTLSPPLPEPWPSGTLATASTEGAVWGLHILIYWKNQTPFMQTSIWSPQFICIGSFTPEHSHT